MRIRELREDNDFNQEEVAKILNVQQATYSRYETGALEISLDDLCKLADFYHTSTDYILGVTNDPKAHSLRLVKFFTTIL